MNDSSPAYTTGTDAVKTDWHRLVTIRRSYALRLFGLGCGLVLAASVTAQPEPATPNIVFIMTDDVGYGDIGSYGAPDIRTPNIDQLARDGVRFTDFYANGPTCTPTRAGFVTGRYQQRYGLEIPLPSPPAEGRGLPASGNSLPQLLKNTGYSTGLIGKWHLGYADNQSPAAHGFDYFFGFKSGYIDYYQHTNGLGEEDLWENATVIQQDGYMTDLITQRSLAFIRDNSTRPFFLSVQYNAAHWPYQPPDMPSISANHAAHVQPHMANTGTREDYVAMLERADEGIGMILQALDEAGLSANTLVIFTNDNGGEWLSRTAPLFNRKGTVWEGGIRVPAIFRWPGVIPAGQVTHQVGITMDISATLLAVSKAEVPASLQLEGINLMPVLSGSSPNVSRTLFWRTQTEQAVRSGDMKLVMQSGRAYIYNVKDDVGERNDLTSMQQAEARHLRGLLDAWEADVDAEGKTALGL
jgi:arylsulfatase A-like enzyme